MITKSHDEVVTRVANCISLLTTKHNVFTAKSLSKIPNHCDEGKLIMLRSEQ